MKIRKWLRGLRKKGLQPDTTWTSNQSVGTSSVFVSPSPGGYRGDSSTEPVKDTRKEAKPVDVVNELSANVPLIDLRDLDKKITAVKVRIKTLKRSKVSNLSNETVALGYLQARKKFKKYGKLFVWGITNQEILNNLCSHYKVVVVGLGAYVRNVPQEGVEEIEKFLDAWEKVSDDEPTFSLVIDDGGTEMKKDPILFATSPFGNWYYILGAWDKEVQYIDEIIYKGQ